MNLTIRKYHPKQDYLPLRELIQSEGEEWNDCLTPNYRKALDQSITYVALVGPELCGYSRSIKDADLFIIIMDLLVHKDHRGNAIGKKLMECITIEFPQTEVYVLSDVDPYYTRLGYQKEGSIFKVKASISK